MNFVDDPLPAQFLRHVQIDDFVFLVALCLTTAAYVSKGLLWDRPDANNYKLYEKPQDGRGVFIAPEQSRDLPARMDKADAKIAVVWASQSGTAERLAARLTKDIIRHFGAKTILVDVSEIEPASCANIRTDQILIFLASTFGEGDPSDNMHAFWAWLHSSANPALPNMRYVAFGLGNSNYKHYNRVVDALDEALKRRDAQPLMKVGKADDAKGETEENYYEWKERLLQMFEQHLHYERKELQYEPSYEIVEDSSVQPTAVSLSQSPRKDTYLSRSNFRALPIANATELLASSADRNCLHLEFDTAQAPELKYKTGDYLTIWPNNPNAAIDLLARVLGLDEAKMVTPVRITALDDAPAKVPSPTTIDSLLRSYLEICAPVSREGIKSLISHAPTTSSKDFLVRISRDISIFMDFTARNYLTLGTLLNAACDTPGAWSDLPLSLIVEMLPPMQPRYYSISSSSMVDPKRIAITVTVADKTSAATGTHIPGLATNYLLFSTEGSHPRGLTYGRVSTEQLDLRGHVHIGVRKSTFKPPIITSAPVVMVGAGSGVAPFRAFVQERARLRKIGKEVGPTRLFFGCRNPNEDFLYAADFSEWSVDLADRFEMHVAHSRPTDGSPKQYVQNLISQQAEDVVDLLVAQNAYFYICGSAAMARDVSATVEQIIKTSQNWAEVDFVQFADRQKRQKRWLQDVWA